MSEWAPKRFWKDAAVVPEDGLWLVELDGRRVKTPAKATLTLPTEPLAQAVAEEWQAQGERIDPGTMPFTRTANSALDKVRHQRAAVVEMLAEYGDADLLCYRADRPEDLAERQRQEWDPFLDWAAEVYGARLEPRAGIMHAPQDGAALTRLRAQVDALGPFRLAAFHDLVALSGSLVLAFAAAERRAEAEEIWQVSRLDERFQEEQWGHDEEAAEVAEIKRLSFLQAERFYRLAEGETRPA